LLPNARIVSPAESLLFPEDDRFALEALGFSL
jgi:hypothetical protein